MERKIGKWKVEEGHEATAGCYPKKKKKKQDQKQEKKGSKTKHHPLKALFKIR